MLTSDQKEWQTLLVRVMGDAWPRVNSFVDVPPHMLAISAILDAANVKWIKEHKESGKPPQKPDSIEVIKKTDFNISTESLVADHHYRYQCESTFREFKPL